jgi:F-type H+-transporting ATPase subunit O
VTARPRPTIVVAVHPLIITSMLLASSARSAYRTPGLGRRAASAIASKYSKAVFGAALSKSPQTLTQVHTELSNFSKTIQTNPDIRTFVNNPTLSLQDRNKGLQTLFAKLEGTGPKKDKISDVTKNFFGVLSENGRLGEVEGVIEDFNELVAQHKGELTVTVTSATLLGKDILSRLETTLKQSKAARAAKVVKISNKVR